MAMVFTLLPVPLDNPLSTLKINGESIPFLRILAYLIKYVYVRIVSVK